MTIIPSGQPAANLFVLSAFLLICALTGCQGQQRLDDGRPGGIDPALHDSSGEHAIGITLELRVDEPGPPGGRRHALYLIDERGRLSFAGGPNVNRREFTWTGSLTEEEARRLVELIDKHELDRVRPTATGEPPDLRYSLSLRTDRGANRFRLTGECEPLAALHALLDSAALRRLETDPLVEQLPEPSQRRR